MSRFGFAIEPSPIQSGGRKDYLFEAAIASAQVQISGAGGRGAEERSSKRDASKPFPSLQKPGRSLERSSDAVNETSLDDLLARLDGIDSNHLTDVIAMALFSRRELTLITDCVMGPRVLSRQVTKQTLARAVIGLHRRGQLGLASGRAVCTSARIGSAGATLYEDIVDDDSGASSPVSEPYSASHASAAAAAASASQFFEDSDLSSNDDDDGDGSRRGSSSSCSISDTNCSGDDADDDNFDAIPCEDEDGPRGTTIERQWEAIPAAPPPPVILTLEKRAVPKGKSARVSSLQAGVRGTEAEGGAGKPSCLIRM